MIRVLLQLLAVGTKYRLCKSSERILGNSCLFSYSEKGVSVTSTWAGNGSLYAREHGRGKS